VLNNVAIKDDEIICLRYIKVTKSSFKLTKLTNSRIYLSCTKHIFKVNSANKQIVLLLKELTDGKNWGCNSLA